MKYSEAILNLANRLLIWFPEVHHSAEIIHVDNDRFPAIIHNQEWKTLEPTDQKETLYIRRNGIDRIVEPLKIGGCAKAYLMQSPLRIVYFRDHSDKENEIIAHLMQGILLQYVNLESVIRDKWKLLKEESSGDYNFGPDTVYLALNINVYWHLMPDNCEEDWCATTANPLEGLPVPWVPFVPEHNHDDRYYTETEIDTILGGYYTESETDILLTGKSDVGHTHTKSEISDFAHTHPQSDITNLVTDLAGKAPLVHTHVQADITDLDAYKPDILIASQLLGSAIKAFACEMNFLEALQSTTLADGQVRYAFVVVRRAMTVNGVAWRQATQGNYTADNNNKLALHSISAGVLTKVAETANDGNLWKGASNSYQTKNFSSPYAAVAGLYFISLLYNNSSQVQAPLIGCAAASFNDTVTMDYTNSGKLLAALNGQTDIPTPTNMSALAFLSVKLALALI